MLDSLRLEIRDALNTLKPRERDVIKMYFGIDREYALTLNEIGEEFSLTRERIRQIKENAIRRLSHKSRSKKLRSYLG
jgi:RNA polymerase primary sigma factor